jgi:hypothetical protein
MKKSTLLTITILFSFLTSAFAKEATALQYFFLVKKIFPEKTEVSVFIDKDRLGEEKDKIARASAQTGLKALIFEVDDQKSIGQNLRQLADNQVLILYGSPVVEEKSSVMFILSKCKSKGVSIFTASRAYSESGALLGILNDEVGAELVLNLKQNEQLATVFNENFIQEVGIKRVIR